jgi:NADH-quinone oxidoreductase subunit E
LEDPGAKSDWTGHRFSDSFVTSPEHIETAPILTFPIMTDTATLPTAAPAGESRQVDRLPANLVAQADELISHYPVSKRSASLPLIHLWQNYFGSIDQSGIEWIAARLELQPINIYELVTFYPWFRQEAPGRNIIRVCRTLSCALAGSEALHARFCEALGIDPEAARHHHGPGLPTSEDGAYSIEFVECLASCGTAPVCLVNEDLHENVAPEEVPEILEQYKDENAFPGLSSATSTDR